jgi:hypothetical protein
MTEKIKIALLHWARKVIDQNVEWDDEKTHDAIQNLYELSIVQKMLLEQKHTDQNLWRYQQAQLNEMIESLTGKPKTESSKEENMEVAPMMETIKNMVTEMPEPETFEKLFETVEETPTFVPKAKEPVAEPLKTKNVPTEDRKNINDHFAKTLSIDLNDRLAFVTHLFEGDAKNYQSVLAQVVTFESWPEITHFIETKVQTEYNNWEGKQEVVERFLSILKKNFEE